MHAPLLQPRVDTEPSAAPAMLSVAAEGNPTRTPSPADEMLHRIRRKNLAFLRDQSIFSSDYVSFVYNLAQGVLVS